MRIHRRRGEDGRLPPRGQAPNFGGVAKCILAAYFRSLVLDREVEVSAARIALPHRKMTQRVNPPKAERESRRHRAESAKTPPRASFRERHKAHGILEIPPPPASAPSSRHLRSRFLALCGFFLFSALAPIQSFLVSTLFKL